MDNSKKFFSEYVDTFKEHVEVSREEFERAEEESEKILQSKIAMNKDFAEKIEERFLLRTEKHNANTLKSKESYDDKIEKSILLHETKLKQIETVKEKRIHAFELESQKEKSKLDKTLASLETKYRKDEKKCLVEIEKAAKKADGYLVSNLVNRIDREGQNQIKNIHTIFNDSIIMKTNHNDQSKKIISKLKENQAELKIQSLEFESRVEKLKRRLNKEELNHSANIIKMEQHSIIDEFRAKFDLEKITINYEYNILNEQLKTTEQKIHIDSKLNIYNEELRYYEDSKALDRDREYQLDKESVTLETINQKEKADVVKNNFALSSKEHKNLFIYEKALYSTNAARDNLNLKLSIEEIDVRTKQLLERMKIAITELKTSLDYITAKVKANLKTELTMPTEHIKNFEAKFKIDQKELTKTYNTTKKDLNAKLSILDPSFDNIKLKELKARIEDVDNRYIAEAKDIETVLNKSLQAFNSKIEYANNRANKILTEAKEIYEKHLGLYNNEIKQIKENEENEKANAKKHHEEILTSNNNSLQFLKELNEIAISENNDTVSYLVDLAQSNIEYAINQKELRDVKTLEKYEGRVKSRRAWFEKHEAQHQKEVNSLDTKLQNFTDKINKKLDSERKDVDKQINRIKSKLKVDLQRLTKDHKKITYSFEKAIKDAESKFNKANKTLMNEKKLLLNQLDPNVVEGDYDIFIDVEEITLEKVLETDEETIT